MTTEVQELAPGDIQRPTATQAAPAPKEQQRQAVTEQSGEAPVMSADSQRALSDAQTMGQRLSDPTLTHGQRDALMRQVAELQRFANGNGDKPNWYAQTPDARMVDQSPHDSLAASLADVANTLTKQDSDQITALGKLRGLTPDQAGTIAEFAAAAGLDKSTAKTLMERAAHHANTGWFGPLSKQDVQELQSECARSFGGVEKAAKESALARKYLKSVGLENADFGSLSWDPATILAFAYRGRLLGSN
jgi:hypothetical protein